MRKKFLIICVLVSTALLLSAVAMKHGEGDLTEEEREEITSPTIVTLRIGESQSGFGISLTPTLVLEDSRCPLDATCVQAGTVRLETSFQSGASSLSQVFVLGQPVEAGENQITLSAVRPDALSGKVIASEDYQFVFTIQ